MVASTDEELDELMPEFINYRGGPVLMEVKTVRTEHVCVLTPHFPSWEAMEPHDRFDIDLPNTLLGRPSSHSSHARHFAVSLMQKDACTLDLTFVRGLSLGSDPARVGVGAVGLPS
jgi:hypothetical protein